jgi:hypothetical protein
MNFMLPKKIYGQMPLNRQNIQNLGANPKKWIIISFLADARFF